MTIKAIRIIDDTTAEIDIEIVRIAANDFFFNGERIEAGQTYRIVHTRTLYGKYEIDQAKRQFDDRFKEVYDKGSSTQLSE